METLKLTLNRNGQEEIYTTDVIKLPYKVTKKLMGLLDINLNTDFDDPGEAIALINKFSQCVEQLEPVILWVFPELTAEDLEEGGDTEEIITIACKVVLFTLKNCFTNIKNVLKVKATK